jgi:predicted Co/Zn/Cd cation transporter (cation efflux family)
MGKDKKTPITINGKEHIIEDMTAEQQTMVNHIADLERKLNTAQFNMDQLRVGRDAFVNILTAQMAEEEKEADRLHLEDAD